MHKLKSKLSFVFELSCCTFKFNCHINTVSHMLAQTAQVCICTIPQ